MPTHAEKRVIPYSAKQMFDLVLDVEKYPEFLPWCTAARIREKKQDVIIADLVIGYKMISDTYTSRITFKRNEKINVDYESGPLHYLNNHWIFKDMKDKGCEVDFFVDFAFQSHILQGAMEFFFNEAVSVMVNAFEERAHDLYKRI